jgi:hypothetical protein
VRAPGAAPTVYYTGVFRRVEEGRAVFRDGSTLRVGNGVALPHAGAMVRAEIDPGRHVVRAFTGV